VVGSFQSGQVAGQGADAVDLSGAERGVAADAAKARALYRKAFDLGMARAQNRLDALRP